MAVAFTFNNCLWQINVYSLTKSGIGKKRCYYKSKIRLKTIEICGNSNEKKDGEERMWNKIIDSALKKVI